MIIMVQHRADEPWRTTVTSPLVSERLSDRLRQSIEEKSQNDD
jgi:hypothetical protein